MPSVGAFFMPSIRGFPLPLLSLEPLLGFSSNMAVESSSALRYGTGPAGYNLDGL